MDRLTWLVLALILLLGGAYLHQHALPDWVSYLTAGVGPGIGLALAGSLIHDAFAGQPRR